MDGKKKPPANEATNRTRDATTTEQKPTKTNHRSKGKDKTKKANQERATKEKRPRYSKMSRMEGPDDFLSVRLNVETEEPSTAKSRIARGNHRHSGVRQDRERKEEREGG